VGWKNSHLHSFKIRGEEYGVPHPDYDDLGMPMKDEKKITLKQIAAKEIDKFTYEYDPGDSWRHSIKIEETLKPDETVHYPICMAGERACPPEDVGGTPGYETFLAALADKKHKEHQTYKEWIGGSFNPESFDANLINNFLHKTGWVPTTKQRGKDNLIELAR
jgi:hypothetical protein